MATVAARSPRGWVVVAIVAALALLPFVAKPFHVDDPLFLWAARQVTVHPLDPYGMAGNWDGHAQRFPEFMQNPPGVAYYLAAVARVVGWSEVALHAAMLPVGVLAVVGTCLLAVEMNCRRPAVAALLLLGCPGFLVSATTLMSETPLLCLWVWAVWLWVRGSTAARPWPWLIGAGLATAAAGLVKYPGVNLVPLLAAHAVLCPAGRPARVAQAVALLVPVAVLIAYDRATAHLYGYGLLSDAVVYSRRATAHNPVSLAGRTVDAVCFVGGGGLAVAAVTLSGWRRWLAGGVVAVTAAVAARVWFSVPPVWADPAGPSPWGFFGQAGVLAAAGVGVLWACAVGARDPGLRGTSDVREGLDRRGLFLLLWAGGVFTFAAFLNWSTNVRSVLPMLPAACILAARATDGVRLPKVPLAFAVAVTGVVAVADYRFAADNRAAAARVPTAASPVWFGGHWGFQWYMEQAGGRPLDADHPQRYRPGDLVVLPLDNYGTRPVAAPLVPQRTYAAGPTGPWASTMTLSAGAGFYFSPGDRLPFVFGPVPPQAYQVDRIGPPSN